MSAYQAKLQLSPKRYMDYVDSIDHAAGSDNLFDHLPLSSLFRMGAYLHIPSIGGSTSDFPKKLHHQNLPQEGIDAFQQAVFDRLPPCATSAFKKGSFCWLSDIANAPETPNLDKVALQFYLTMTVDGLCIPLFGPHNANGYMFIGFRFGKEEATPEFPFQIHALAQLLHIRICHIAEERQSRTKLSKRELDVLELICLGKTNAEIGLILNITTNTVSGYVSQLFLKLGVSDRVSAAMRRQSMKIAI